MLITMGNVLTRNANLAENTDSHKVTTLKVEPLDDYDIIKSNKNVNKEYILDKLNKNFAPQFKKYLKNYARNTQIYSE